MVSVIVPIYNVEKYLCACIESILNQTYSDLQIILVDDGSPDRCGEICDEYAQKDKRIEVIHKENGGLGYARNSGLELARGEYVIFIDSDDWIDSNHIETLITTAHKTNADVVIHGFQKCTDDGKVLVKEELIQHGEFFNVVKDVLYPMIASGVDSPADRTLPVSTWCKMYRLAIIKDNGLQFVNEKECISEDIMFNLSYFPCCKRAVICGEYGYNYRYNPDSISNAYNTKRTERMYEFYRRIMDWGTSFSPSDQDLKLRLYRCYITKCRIGVNLVAQSDLSYKEKIYEIKKIICHEYAKDALSKYPLKNYSMRLRIVAELMKHGFVRTLIILYSRR